MRLLIATLPPDRPKSAKVLFYTGKIANYDGEYEEAVRIFKPLLTGAADIEQRNEIADAYVSAMANLGKPLEGYDAVTDKRIAFEYLADYLLNSEDTKLLEQLIERHSTVNNNAYANDGYVDLVKARLLIRPLNNYETVDGKPAELPADVLTQALDRLNHAAQRIPKDREQLHEDMNYYRIQVMVAQGRHVAALSTIKPAGKTFSTIATMLDDNNSHEKLDELIAAHARTHPNNPWLHYYKGEAAMRLKQYEAASQAYAKAMEFDEEDSYAFRWGRAKAMCKLGKFMQAYDEIEPKGSSFNQLASLLMTDKNGKGLVELSLKHIAADPSSYDGHYRLAEAYRLNKQHDLAEQTAIKALTLTEKDYQKKSVFRIRVNNRYEEGRWQIAYDTYGDKPEVFRILTTAMSDNKDASSLRQLLAAHGQPKPFWSAEADFIEGRYEQALSILLKNYESLTDRGSATVEWKTDDRIIRCMIRLKQFKEAKAFMKEKLTEYQNIYFGAIIAAVEGDVASTAELVVLQVDPYDDWYIADVLEEIYADEDAGPALMTEAFAEFRKKYPKPTED